MTISKLAQYSIDMAFDVPDKEKAVGKTAVDAMNKTIKQLDELDNYLNIIYKPFSDHNIVSEESVVKYRGFIIRYKKKLKEMFEFISRSALDAIKQLKYFSNDSNTTELIKSMIDSFSDINKQIINFEKVLDDFKSKQFREMLVKSVESIKKQKLQLENFIVDRIITHINTNILAINWVDSLSQEFNVDIKEREPYAQRLYKEREEALKKNNGVK